MNSTVPATPSKNPFLNPPNSNNPFLRKPSAGQTSTSDSEDASVIDAAQRYPQLPPEPPAGVRQASPPLPPIPPHPTGMVLTPMPPVMPTQVPPLVSPPPLPARRPTQPVPAETPTTPSIRQQPQQQPILEVNSEPVRNPDNMTDEEALAAAIQASLNLVDGPVFTPPPGPPPGRSSSSPATPQPTRRTSPPAPVEAQPTGASSTPSNPPPPFELEPPPYTPSPDAYTETTVEVGPRRPFQNPTRAQPRRVPGGYPGSVSRQRTGASSADLGTSWRADVTIPPSDSGPYLAPQATGWSARSNSQPDLTLLDSSSSTGGSFSPPPGPPSSRSSAPRNSETSEDDGKPTTSPTPGRPLLNKGKTLVYPPGYFCHKCNNTGYKSFDPSNLCSKCWSKYAKDYSGPLTYAPWANRSLDTNYQRPLPRTFGPGSTALSLQRGQSSSRPSWSAGPGESYRSTSSSWGGSSNNVSLCRTFSSTIGPRRLTKGRLAVAIASEIASAVGSSNRNRYGTHSRDHSPQVARSLGLPPPGSVVVRPGDPRIGGRRCYNCGGDGTISFFLFEERCPTCRGTGRVGI